MAKQRSFFKSLRGKVSLQMLIVSLLPVLVIGGLVWSSMANLEDNTSESVDNSYDSLEQDVIQANLSGDAYRLSLDMEKTMAARIDYMQTYASSPVVVEAARVGDPESPEAKAANTFLAEQLEITPYFTVFSLADADGEGISGGYNDVDGTIKEGVMWVYEMLYGNDFTQLEWWEPFTESETGVYIPEAVWVNGALINIEFGFHLVEIVVEVTDSDGTVIGEMVGSTVFFPTDMSMEYAVKYPNSRIMAFNRAGEIIADSGDWMLSDQDINGDGQLNDAEPRKTTDVDWSEEPVAVMRWYDYETNDMTAMEKFPFTVAEQKVRSDIESADQEIIKAEAFTTESGDYVVGYARAATSSLEEALQTEGYVGSGFTFMTEQPKEVAFAALESLDELESDLEDNTQSVLTMVVIILVAVLVVVLAVAFFLSRGIVRPIVQLSEAAEKVSMGDLDVNVEVKSNDEIGDLADSFGRMVTAYRFMAEDEGE